MECAASDCGQNLQLNYMACDVVKSNKNFTSSVFLHISTKEIQLIRHNGQETILLFYGEQKIGLIIRQN